MTPARPFTWCAPSRWFVDADDPDWRAAAYERAAVQPCDEDNYWQLHRAEPRSYFNPTVPSHRAVLATLQQHRCQA